MHHSLNFATLLLLAVVAAPTNAAETLICTDRCQIFSCEERSCSVFICEEGACAKRAEFEAEPDFTSVSSDQVYGDGNGVHCGTSRCAVTTCNSQTCNTYGFDQGDHQVLHSAANPEVARNRAVQAFLAERGE